MAAIDAAFHAYVALYEKALLNDNLLPLMGEEAVPVFVESRLAVDDVSQTTDPPCYLHLSSYSHTLGFVIANLDEALAFKDPLYLNVLGT